MSPARKTHPASVPGSFGKSLIYGLAYGDDYGFSLQGLCRAGTVVFRG